MEENKEDLFAGRTLPWEDLGKSVKMALDSSIALKIAGLDWDVQSRPVEVNRRVLDEYVANVRSTDNKVLGIVGRDYKIVQNRDAFAFTDHLCSNGDIRFEDAGGFHDGRRIWLLASMAEISILGDKLQSYLVFTNGHDGRNALRVAITPVRVSCANMLNLALKNAERSWALRHVGNMEEKLREAARTVERSWAYLAELEHTAQKLYEVTIPDENKVKEYIDGILPLPKEAARHKRILDLREELFVRYKEAPDLKQYRGTGWGLVNAVSDLAGHSQPGRPGPTFKENRFARQLSGSAEVDRAVRLLLA